MMIYVVFNTVIYNKCTLKLREAGLYSLKELVGGLVGAQCEDQRAKKVRKGRWEEALFFLFFRALVLALRPHQLNAWNCRGI